MKKYSKLMAVLLVVAMLLPGIAQAAPVTEEVNGVNVTRLGGTDRIGTSVLASQEAYDKADAVVLAGFGGDVDALTGTLLAANKKAPLLITRKFELSDAVKTEIERLGAKTVYILGGETAVGEEVETALEAMTGITVERVEGANRNATAAKVAKEVKGTNADHVFLALGRMPVETDALADALAIGPVSAKNDMPVLLTEKNRLPAETIAAMKDLGTTKVTIIGGTSAISQEVEDMLEDYTVDRVFGDGREDTALEIAAKYFPNPKNLIVAYGRKSADALVGGYLGALKNAPILLTNNAGLTTETKAYISENVLDTFVLGSTEVVPQTAFDQIVEALKGEEVDELMVESVSAINAEEILVTFNTDIDKATGETIANYDLKVNGNTVTPEAVKVDGKTALIRVQTGDEFTVGDKFVLQIKDAVTSTDGTPIERYASEEMNFILNVAPKLVETNLDGNANKLVLEFDRPIDVASPTLIKLDDVSLPTPGWAAQDVTEPGNYKYNVDLTTTNVQNLAKKAGKHNIVIFDVAETAKNNPAEASMLTGSYTVKANEDAPVVKSLIAINSNRFFVELSKASEAIEPKITVEKGNHVFPSNTIEENSSAASPDTTSASSELFAQAGTYEKAAGTTVPGYFVVITDADTNDDNPLYKGTETSVNLKVTFENFQEVGSSLLGEKYQGNVTLKQDTAKPTVKSAKIVGTDILVEFNDVLTAAPALVDIVVRNKDNVVVTPDGVALDGTAKVVEIDMTTADVEDEPYTIEFKANKLTYKAVDNDVKTYVLESNKNDKLMVTAKSAGASNFKYVALGSGTASITDPNEITIAYGMKMDSSATNLANYKFDNQALPTGTTIDFVGDTETVVITLPAGKIVNTTSYKLTVSTSVKTAANEHVVANVQTKTPYEEILTLTDNVKPELVSAKFINIDSDTKLTDEIEITFSEEINVIDSTTDFDDLLVKVVGNTVEVVGIDDTDATDGKIIITLANDVNTSQKTTMEVVAEHTTNNPSVNFTDVEGNEIKAGTVVTVSK